MTDQSSVEQWQAVFQPMSMLTGTMQKNAHAFWNIQAEFLNGLQAFAEGWFQRRHIGTQAARETCERMCEAKTPIEWFHEYQMWSMQALQRLMTDSLAFHQGMQKIAEGTSPSVVPSIGKEHGSVIPAKTSGQARAEA